MDWLDCFEWVNGAPRAVGRAGDDVERIHDLSMLAKDGLVSLDSGIRDQITTNFADWHRVSADRFLTGIGCKPTGTEGHSVYSFRAGGMEFLVPALAVLRGLFPLPPAAFSWILSPRSLDLLCAPIERLGHWSVLTTQVRRDRGAGTQRPMIESLTWASLYPSAYEAWRSASAAMKDGRMHIELPMASVRVLPKGIKHKGVFYVTQFVVSAVQAHERPHEFAGDAPSSFLWSTRSEPIGPKLNDYRESSEPHPLANALSLSDEEWRAIEPLCAAKKKDAKRPGRSARLNPRHLVDSFIVRAATGARWEQVARGSLRAYSVERSWANWRTDGRLHTVLSSISALRGERYGTASHVSSACLAAA